MVNEVWSWENILREDNIWGVIGALIITVLLFTVGPLLRHYVWEPYIWPWLARRLGYRGYVAAWDDGRQGNGFNPALFSAPPPAPAPPAPPKMPDEPEPLAAALWQLPSLVHLGTMLHERPQSPTTIPIGVAPDYQAVWLDLATEALHIGLYAQSGAGKDNLLRAWFLSLCARNEPYVIQFAFLDGKGDWLIPNLARAAHMFIPPAGGYGKKGDAVIQQAIKRIDAEAERRQQLITSANCTTREQYIARTGDVMPLLVVVATDVMTSVAGEVEALLVNLVSKARSLGIRVIVSMQTPTGRDSRWRMNLSTVVAGPLQSGDQDRVALGVDVKSMRYRPSRLPDPQQRPGVFVARKGNHQMLVQAPYVSDKAWDIGMRRLPVREDGVWTLTEETTEDPLPSDDVVWSAEHVRIALWLAAEPDISIREVARRLYPGKDGSGGYSTQARALIEQVQPLVDVVKCEVKDDKLEVPEQECFTVHQGNSTTGTPLSNKEYQDNVGVPDVPDQIDKGASERTDKVAVTDAEICRLFNELGSRNKVMLALGNRLRGQKQARLARIEAALSTTRKVGHG